MGLDLVDKYRNESKKERKKYPDMERNKAKKGLDDDYDAFTHIYSSAVVTFDVANFIAELADFREYWSAIFGKGVSKKRAQMDLYNNTLGRKIGRAAQTRKEISFTVYQAIKANLHVRLIPPQIKNDTTSPIEKNVNINLKKQGAYIWRTKGDNKVRSTHAFREGQVFNWENPPDDGHPGEAYGCRCTAESYTEEKSNEILKKLFR